MSMLGLDTITAIDSIPGLYISGLSGAREPVLIEQNIKHVVSLAKVDLPGDIQHLQIEIEDSPMEDLLQPLEVICPWLDDALPDRVLVHCLQGLSRSAAVVIGYIMRTKDMCYEDALAEVCKHRPVRPNSGFEEQLKLWRDMGYSVNLDGKPKQMYVAWKAGRDRVRREGPVVEQRMMAKNMAGMAAAFARRREKQNAGEAQAEKDVS